MRLNLLKRNIVAVFISMVLISTGCLSTSTDTTSEEADSSNTSSLSSTNSSGTSSMSSTDSSAGSTTPESSDGSIASVEAALVVTSGLPTLEPGESDQLKLVTYDNAGEIVTSPIAYSTKNSSVATVSQSGKLEVVGIGATTVIASTTVDGKTVSLNIPVVGLNPARKIIIAPPAFMGMAGDSFEIIALMTVVGYYSLEYTTSDENVASVDALGNVTLKNAGVAQITVVGAFKGATETAFIGVTVLPEIVPPPVLAQIKLTRKRNAHSMIFEGDQVSLQAQGYSLDGKEMEAAYSWYSDADSIATVNNRGVVSAVTMGSTMIRATAMGVEGNYLLEVLPDTIIIVTPMMTQVSAGQTEQFKAEVFDLKNDVAVSGVHTIKWALFDPVAEMLNFGTSFGEDQGIDIGGMGDMPDMQGEKASISTSGLVKIPSSSILASMMIVTAELDGSTDVHGGAIAYVGMDAGFEIPDSDISASSNTERPSSSSRSLKDPADGSSSHKSASHLSSSSRNPSSENISSTVVLVEVVDISPSNIEASPGTTVQFSAVVVYKDNGNISGTTGVIVWEIMDDISSDMLGGWPTVDATGKVTIPDDAFPGMTYSVIASLQGSSMTKGLSTIMIPMDSGM
ncbi:MAG: Ig-like domain-containing protein [Fibrobacterales bacterium]